MRLMAGALRDTHFSLVCLCVCVYVLDIQNIEPKQIVTVGHTTLACGKLPLQHKRFGLQHSYCVRQCTHVSFW